jgi:hypothetical protein
MAAFFAEVEFARAVRAGDFAFGEMHSQFDQLGNAGRAFLDDGANDIFFAEAGAGFEGVADMEFKGIFLAGDSRDAALSVVGVGFGAIFFGDDRDASVRRDF